MTDPLSGKQDAQRILDYAESLAKEARKALTVEFNQKHKGIPFNTTAQVLRESLLAWFSRRDLTQKKTPALGGQMKNGDVSNAIFYHQTTKHSEISVRTSAHYLDWDNRPSRSRSTMA